MSDVADLGGKGANLVRLREAGFDVPPFVVLPVWEYHEFVAEHGLTRIIAKALRDGDPAAASEVVRAAFARPIPPAQRERLVTAIGDLARAPVAVRSSATAEDLPQASFAGQQDTFLEVSGLDAILDAVVACWSSLWTERAIAYRARAGVGDDGLVDGRHDDECDAEAGGDVDGGAASAGLVGQGGSRRTDTGGLGLAVVVQEQVHAEVSGVVFTADPLTGHRARVVVDAVTGLGERLVSGQVTPDHWAVEGDRIVELTVQGSAPVLSEDRLLALVALCRRVETAFGAPQDIEFTLVGDRLQLVQSRPITSLFPVPNGPREAIYLSFGAPQGVLGPLTPLGRDVLRAFAAGAAGVFGASVDYRTNQFVVVAGERLWVRVDRLLTGPAGPLFRRVVPIGEPVAAAILSELSTEPTYTPRRERAALATVGRRAGGVVLPRLPRVAAGLRDPEAARARFTARTDDLVADVQAAFAEAGGRTDPEARLRARTAVVTGRVAGALGAVFSEFLPIMGPSVLMLARLRALAARTGLPDADALALTVLRSLAGNVTAEMDLALYEVARRIGADPASREALSEDAAAAADAYLAGEVPPVAAEALTDFLDRYGMRGVAEIDLGSPRWRERPEQVVRTVQTYLDDADHAASYEEGHRAAQEAIDRLAHALPRHQAVQVRFLAGRIRGLFGLRETPKFTLVRVLGLVRQAMLDSGRDLVAAGRLDAPEDVVLLTLEEVPTAFGTDLRAVVAARRADRSREERRTRVPVVLVGDGRAFTSAPGSAAADLVGTGVSPGVVTAPARIVTDPATARLLPGEIMVCRGTDPAWTPLFLTAGGLVTEVGGLMTHGSVVAREYGLPAVVGITAATEVLRDGDVLTLDGSAGTIVRIDDDAPSTSSSAGAPSA